jgi:hypothetical protein
MAPRDPRDHHEHDRLKARPVGDRPPALPLGHLDRRDHLLDDLLDLLADLEHRRHSQPHSRGYVSAPEFARGYANPWAEASNGADLHL